MKKTILYKEKTNKMYLLMLCGLLVSGAIVCSTNGNGNGNGDGNGNGNGNPLMFACPNGTAVMPTADNRPIVMGVENCASCNTDAGFSLEAVRGSNRMVCRTPYVCPDGVAVIPTEDDRPTMTNVENCVFCNDGFVEVTQDGRTTCRTPYACPNGVAVVPIGDNMPTAANVENCAECDKGFVEVTQDDRIICRSEFVCPRGTAESGMTTTANVENCSACDPGFGDLVAVAGSDPARSICSGNDLPIALWNAGRHDGDFGFDFCQNSIAQSYTGSDAAVTAQRSRAIATEIRDRGYTKAVFFGSTNTYDFPDIGTDTDALALPGPVSVSDRQLVVFAESATSTTVILLVFDTFGSPAMARTLDNVTNVADGGGWQNGGDDVVLLTGLGIVGNVRAWSFTSNRAYSSNHCNNASTTITISGGIMNLNSVDIEPTSGSVGSACNTMQFVLCVAR